MRWALAMLAEWLDTISGDNFHHHAAVETFMALFQSYRKGKQQHSRRACHDRTRPHALSAAANHEHL
nr:hypothetical protein CFP56_71925 [Quercus suber]